MFIKFDLVVIGVGLVGEGVVMWVVKVGLEIVMVDEKVMVGGNCVYLGIILLKVLWYVVK